MNVNTNAMLIIIISYIKNNNVAHTTQHKGVKKLAKLTQNINTYLYKASIELGFAVAEGRSFGAHFQALCLLKLH